MYRLSLLLVFISSTSLVAQAVPVARVVVQPAEAAIQVGDSIRLSAVAYDSAGRTVAGAKILWITSGGRFEGAVDSTGLVVGGATGTVVITALAQGGSPGRPIAALARITVLPLPASRIVFEPSVSRMTVGQSLAIAALPYASNGDRRYDQASWASDNPNVLKIGSAGRITALAPGKAAVTVHAGKATESFTVTVAPNQVASVALEPLSASVRTGDVVRFNFSAKSRAGGAVADVIPEWSLAPGGAQIDSDGGFVAEMAGTYQVFASFAGHRAEAVVEVRPRDAVRPATLVGRLAIKMMAGEFWLHPDGKHGYLTTLGLSGGGGDRMYAIDVSDPASPFITDSVMVDARVVNDVMTTEDGKFGVMTREGASTRKNGIVVLSFEDPAHPKPIAEFTETVTGGVHSTFIYKGHVYLTDDATGSMRVIDIRDPYHPKQVGRWETPRSPAGRIVHDIDVKDGLAYLSYWNDGLVILDVGNGIKGGSPEAPQLVSQFKYDLNALYRDVEAVGGPGFIRGTHTAWRQGKYVYIGDEVFPATVGRTGGGGVPTLGRAFGRLQVIDVSDITKPKSVAWYEPKDGGSHNVWVAGDTLYLGDYQGGLRVIDISGELRGDLLRQGREIAHVVTGDSKGFVPNSANTWGAIYRNGFIYVPDINSGLWIVKVEAKSALTP